MAKPEIFDAIKEYLQERGVTPYSFGSDMVSVDNANVIMMEKTATLWVVSHHWANAGGETFIIELADPNMFEKLIKAIEKCNG